MKKCSENVALKLVEKATRIRVQQDSYKWPPACAGILHQPKRPKSGVRK